MSVVNAGSDGRVGLTLGLLQCRGAGGGDVKVASPYSGFATSAAENWRREYNQVRPHSSLGYRPPAPEAIQPLYIPFGLTLEVVQ